MRPPSSAPPEAMPPFFARLGGANRLQICVVLYIHGFPFGTQPSHSFELDLLAHLSTWAPVAHVELLLCPQSGWVTGALASFVHETYAQAVLDSMPYARFYGIYLCMELVHTPATLRFRLAEWGTGVQLHALWDMSARPAGLAELVSQHSVKHPRASRRANFSLSLAACYGPVHLLAEVYYGPEYVVDVDFMHVEHAHAALAALAPFQAQSNLAVSWSPPQCLAHAMRPSYVKLYPIQPKNARSSGANSA